MLAGGTRRIVRTGPLETNFITLPLDVVQRVWGYVAELERGTVEWLATRLQSLRRGLVVREQLEDNRWNSAYTGPFWRFMMLGDTAADRVLKLDTFTRIQRRPEYSLYSNVSRRANNPQVLWNLLDRWVSDVTKEFMIARMWVRRLRRRVQDRRQLLQ